jgi:hypothetical protein
MTAAHGQSPAPGRVQAGDHGASGRLIDFLDRVRGRRGRLPRALAYGSLVWEEADWNRFGIIGVGHYLDARIKDRYACPGRRDADR